MKVRYTKVALAEIEIISAYLSERNLQAANNVLSAIDKTVARLAEFPLSSVATDIPNVRVATTYPHAYLVFYTVSDDLVLVRNVRHGARRRPRQ